MYTFVHGFRNYRMLFDSPEEMMRYVKEQSDTVILSFSRGKDSIAAWLQLRNHGLNVIPVHMYTVPGISFVDESLRYYEKAFETKIYNMPHPSFYRQLRGFIGADGKTMSDIDCWCYMPKAPERRDDYVVFPRMEED